MRLLPAIILTALGMLLFCASCSRKTAGASAEVQSIEWDRRWNCFNGCSIVSAGGKYGLVSDEDVLLMQAVYDSLEFISDEVVLALKDGVYSLADKAGHFFAESADAAWLADNYQLLYDDAVAAGIRLWDALLDEFESFGRECMAVRGKLSRSSWKKLIAARDALYEKAASIRVPATETQKERLERITSMYGVFAK